MGQNETLVCFAPLIADHFAPLPSFNMSSYDRYLFILFIYLSQTQKRPYMHTHAKKKKKEILLSNLINSKPSEE